SPFALEVKSRKVKYAMLPEDKIRSEATFWRAKFKSNEKYLKLVDAWEQHSLQMVRDKVDSLPFDSTLIAFGNRVFATTPFETFSHANREIGRHTMVAVYVVGYSNGYGDYWPATMVMDQEGYEGGSSSILSGQFSFAKGSLESFAAETAIDAQKLVESRRAKLPAAAK
ncbi:MAG: hypothetical protein PHQ75_08565, partial [Thermoguttaceae bacterium]|nr:hypothetical protein [Thermoguttaceae bacterium]